MGECSSCLTPKATSFRQIRQKAVFGRFYNFVASGPGAASRALRPVIDEGGITGRGMIPYFNFAQKLGRLSRKYGGKSLQMAASDRVDLYEAKSLYPATLRVVAVTLFGVTNLD